MKEENIFEAVQEKYEIKAVAEDLGIKLHRVGSGFRADSIAFDGTGENAFAIYERTNTWYDFMLKIGGDITDLVAHVKYDDNKADALRELMPDWNWKENDYKVKQQISAREKFMKDIEERCERLFKKENKMSQKAFEYLHSRGIHDQTIRDLKFCLDHNSRPTRIIFPYFDKDGKKILYYISRCYDDGIYTVDEKTPKYKKASLEEFPFLKNSILGLNTLNRKKDELIITEGMFDWLHCYQQGFCALSPNGTDFGKLWPEVLEIIKQQFKKVILMFDSDDAGKQATFKAAEMLLKEQIPFEVAPLPYTKDVAEYCEHGGQIQTLVNSARDGRKWFVDYLIPSRKFDDLTPSEKDKARDKVKNFVRTIAPYTDSVDSHEILLDMRNYFPKEWVSELLTKARKGPKEDEVRKVVREAHKLLYNEKTGFYEYTDKGIWEERDDTEIQCYISNVYGVNVTGGKLTSTLKTLKADDKVYSRIPIENFNRESCIAFLNGTLELDFKRQKTLFRDHREYDYVTVRLPYKFDANAKCPNWEKFVDEVTNHNEARKKILQEFAGYALMPDCKYHKALMLKGGGSNGKSVFTNIISAALGGIGNGKAYISAAEPSKFSKDFRLMPFKNSWLNISSDAETDLRGAEGVFKKIVAGEVLEDSYKHKDPIPFKTRTKLMMCCNNFPLVNDTSEGFMRRWLIVEFPMHYVQANKVKPNSNDRPLDPNLEEKLMKELPGIFVWMYKGLSRLLKQNKFTDSEDQDELIRLFTRANNPIFSFAEDEAPFLKGKKIMRSEIFLKYKTWAEQTAILPVPANRFYSALRDILSNMGMNFTEKNRIWFFEGEQEEILPPEQMEDLKKFCREVEPDFIIHDADEEGHGLNHVSENEFFEAFKEFAKTHSSLQGINRENFTTIIEAYLQEKMGISQITITHDDRFLDLSGYSGVTGKYTGETAIVYEDF